ncbi:hypothetical protein CH76_01835 [Lysinibacillus sp. BF-4]|uniref:hypothetical protein n=1 Tax=Lysinibacillus sp. BF-4 TaxID=1473546 RepID=UPI0005056164|nr:hypothetical protein [Lysinibacillus sp. BF-4]KFL44572.1 hypothetical protein CH76_01835 [Lysinibacillus sp. BF-4]
MKPVINPELVMIRAQLPKQIADVALASPAKALDLIQHWGHGTKPLRDLSQMAHEYLAAAHESLEKLG